MRQNGHAAEFTGRYDATRADYDRKPVKPVIDGETIYEDHPVSFNAKGFGHSVAADVDCAGECRSLRAALEPSPSDP